MTEEKRTSKPLTYADAGVNVQTGEAVVSNMRALIQSTWNEHIIPNVAGFQGVFDLGDKYLIGATDGVGTKLLVGTQAGRITTVGQDLVAMVANDLIRVGAEPLFFLDYLATGKLTPEQHHDILVGIAEGCNIGGIPLIGGETAELPGMYKPEEFDLAGFAVGMVEKKRIIDGKKIQLGATLLGIQSSGIHSNGYSLARKIIFEKLGLTIHEHIPELRQTVAEVLLEPTLIYVKPVLDLLGTFPGRIQGMAHITGGGMPNKLPKCLPEGLAARIETGRWPVPRIFDYLARNGPVEADEMRKTFNMGLGMVMVVNDQGVVPDLTARLQEFRLNSYNIGTIIEGEGVYFI